MSEGVCPFFDARVDPIGLSDDDLESMRFFGLSGALATAHPLVRASGSALRGQFDALVHKHLPRMRSAGIAAYGAVGIHPVSVPRRGLSEVLSALPSYFKGGRVVALGPIGLHQDTEAEEEAFVEQLQLARRLKIPVVVTTPKRDKVRIAKRTLRLLSASGISPSRVLVDRASPHTVPLILECGHFAGLAIHPDELEAEDAAALVRRRGAQRLVISSQAGTGAGDILSVARLVNLLQKGRLSPRLVSRIANENAAEFFRVPAPTWSA